MCRGQHSLWEENFRLVFSPCISHPPPHQYLRFLCALSFSFNFSFCLLAYSLLSFFIKFFLKAILWRFFVPDTALAALLSFGFFAPFYNLANSFGCWVPFFIMHLGNALSSLNKIYFQLLDIYNVELGVWWVDIGSVFAKTGSLVTCF